MLTQDEAKRNLADNLRRILADRKLSPLGLAERAGVPRPTVYGLLDAKFVASSLILHRIAQALDADMDRLIEAPPEPVSHRA